jgi:CpeT protein
MHRRMRRMVLGFGFALWMSGCGGANESVEPGQPGDDMTNNEVRSNNGDSNNNGNPINNAVPNNNGPGANANSPMPDPNNINSQTDPRTVDTLIDNAAETICGALFRCCNETDKADYFAGFLNSQRLIDAGLEPKLPPQVPLTVESCPALIAEAFDVQPFGPWVRSVNAGLASYDQTETEACLEALNTSECGSDLTAAIFDGACFGLSPRSTADGGRRMFQRSSQADETCEALTDGVGGAYYGTCDPQTSWCCRPKEDDSEGCGLTFGAPGVCVPAGQEGDPCGIFPEIAICASGLECGFDSGTCERVEMRPMVLGETCYVDYTLIGSCTNGYCDIFDSQTCKPKISNGDSCAYAYECESSYCNDERVCSVSTYCTEPGPSTTEPPTPGVASPLASKAARFLSGRFDSRDQAASEPSYFEISLKMCPVLAPAYGAEVLYIEQATYGRQSEPYRQRLYVIETNADETEVTSAVYTPTNAAAWVGTCDRTELVEVQAGAFNLKPGCEVVLTETGDTFTGGTRGQGCQSSLNGASYATAAVTLDAAQITSWDQGFSSDGVQVWGAEDGPYRFIRRTPLMTEEEWKALK